MLTDYKYSGLSISQAKIDQKKRGIQSDVVIWGGLEIYTAYKIRVPNHGKVTAEFLFDAAEESNGFDMKVNGYFLLAQGEKIPVLRTWNDPEYEPIVSYDFFSEDRILSVWNVYKYFLPNGNFIEVKWDGNCGFLVEKVNQQE